MNWEAVGSIGEAVGAAGVLASLVYLAVQIRQNTLLMRGTIRQQLTAASQQNMYHWAECTDLVAKLRNGAELEMEEHLRLTQMCRATFRGWANYSYQHRIGLLDSSEWDGMAVTIRMFLSAPWTMKEWETMREEFTASFVAEVETIIYAHAVPVRDEDLAFADFGTSTPAGSESGAIRLYPAPGLEESQTEQSPDPLTANRGSRNLEHETGFEPATLTLAT